MLVDLEVLGACHQPGEEDVETHCRGGDCMLLEEIGSQHLL